MDSVLRAVVLPVLLLVATACSGDPSEPGDAPDDGSFQPGWVYSSEVGDNFRIYVHTPSGFSPADAPDTHLIVLLDADWYMDGSNPRLGDGGVIGITERLAASGAVSAPVILGIGEINRAGDNRRGRDFLTSSDNFLAFIAKTLLPRFLESYASPGGAFRETTLVGHSDGAYIALYALFRDSLPHFRNVVAISGDFTKPYRDLFALEETYAERGVDTPTCIFLGVGGLEEGRFLSSFSTMLEAMESKPHPDLGLTGIRYPDANHGTVVGPAVADGLAFVLSDDCSG